MRSAGLRRITYFLDRPDVLSRYTVRLEADPNEAPILLSNGNPVERGTATAAASITQSGGTRTRSPVTFSRWSAATCADCVNVHDDVRPRGRSAHLRRARQGGARGLGDGFAEAFDGLGRTALRSRVRPRRVQHRCRVGLQHGRDGEQGPQHLQRPAILASPKPRPMPISKRSRAWSHTNTSTTGPAIALPAATGSSCA